MFSNSFNSVLRAAFIAPVILCTLFALLLVRNGCDKPKINESQPKPAHAAIIQSDTISTATGRTCDTHIYYNDVDRQLDTVFRFKKTKQ